MTSNRRFLFALLTGLAVALALTLLMFGAAPWAAIGAAVAQDTTTPPPEPTSTPPPPTSTPLPSATPTLSAPTLVPPTPLPTMTSTPVSLPTASGLAAAQREGVLRIGTYFNAYPFTWLNEQGEVAGYEAEVARAIAAELGIELEFVQVTRHNALSILQSGAVDVLIGQQILSRDRELLVDYTHPYYANQERMVVLTDAPYQALQDLAGQPVSVEIGSRSERVLNDWSARTGVPFDVRPYFTESEALDALANGEVQGMIGELDSLRRAGRQGMRLIDEPVLVEYYGMVVRSGDVHLRDVLNRSLQRLKASGRLEALFADWFPDDGIDFVTLIPIYDHLFEDERQLADFPTDVPHPASTVAERLAAGQPLRVAGIVPFGQDAPAGIWVVNELNRALIEEMARRWEVPIEFIPDSWSNPAGRVAAGQADVAVGVTPLWNPATGVDYSLPYLRHGDRLLVPQQTRIVTGFADMLGTGWWIGYFGDEPEDADLIRKYAEFFNVGANINEPFAIQREEDALYVLTVQRNVDAIFGDNLRFLGLIRKSGETGVKLLPTPYGDDHPLTFAVPRNDTDFRALIDFTLQDMARDGTFQTLWSTYWSEGEPIVITDWPEVNPDGSWQ